MNLTKNDVKIYFDIIKPTIHSFLGSCDTFKSEYLTHIVSKTGLYATIKFTISDGDYDFYECKVEDIIKTIRIQKIKSLNEDN